MGCDYTIGQPFTVATFIETPARQPLINPTFELGDIQILNESNVYVNATNLPVVTPTGTNRIELVVTSAESQQSSLSIRFRDQTDPEAWGELTLELQGESAPAQTVVNSGGSTTSSATEQLPGQYADVLTDDRFVIEYREGTKMGKMMDPKQMHELMKIARENDALKKRRSNGMTRQIVD